MTEEKIHFIIRWVTVAIAIAAMGYALFLARPTPKQTVLRIPDARNFALDPQSLQAQAAIVYDPSSGRVLFAKNEETQLPLASLTKLMTADTALAQSGATSSVYISKQAILTEGDSGLKMGEVWQMGTLLKYALLVSSNDAVAAVAQSGGGKTFITNMNTTAHDLGLAQSYFLDPTGLDLTPGVSGAYSSARDMAVLTSDFYKKYPAFLESTVQSGRYYSDGTHTVSGPATAAPILDMPGLIGAKTGYTDLAGGNLVTVFDASLGHPMIAVVLHSTEAGRFSDMRALINATRTSL